MTESEQGDQQTFGIGAVAKLTGLTDHTIRVWERRYAAVVARRSTTQRREYTAADVEKLGLLKALTDRGMSIGSIARETIDELRARAASVSELGVRSAPQRIDIAILGDFLPEQLANYSGDLVPLHIAVADNNEARFAADLAQQSIDVLVLELPLLNEETIARLRGYMASSRADRAVFVFDFGKSTDIKQLRDSGVVVLRAPVGVDDIKAAVVRTYSEPSIPDGRTQPQQTAPADADWKIAGPIQPRRFSQHQLATLANASSAIECECPTHLAQLVGSLSAFEVYSASCANRDDDDAALHRYLHRAAAEARATIEAALERVAQAEGLAY